MAEAPKSDLIMLNSGLIKAWESPELTSLNKLPPRATFYHFATAKQALARVREKSPWFRSLDGAWQFRLEPTPDDALRLVAAGRSLGSIKWERISVPGNWEMQGYGKPHYTNIQMPWPHEPPHVPTANPTGVYRRLFTIPPAWIGRRIVLHFGGADSVLAVYVNGTAVGLSKDSRLPAEFDITAVAQAGAANEFVAIVIKWSDASFIEDQDMWWLAGLHREVFLYATPLTYLAEIHARPHLGADLRTAELELDVHVGYAGGLHNNARVEIQLLDPRGRAVFGAPHRKTVSSQRHHLAYDRNMARFRVPVPGNRLALWSHESPALYTLLVTLRSPHGASHTTMRLGFRRIEVRDHDLLINARRVLIKGVNHHDHHPDFGKAVPYAILVRDVQLMKQFNFNAVRCSHYPNDPRWLDLCDEYGLYVIDEANLEAHDYYNQLCFDPRYATAWLDRVMRMVVRDKNHPAIVLWSLGNESGYGPHHDAAAGWVRHYDPARPLHYESAINTGQTKLTFAHGSAATDIICPMYASVEKLAEWSDLVSKNYHPAPDRNPRGEALLALGEHHAREETIAAPRPAIPTPLHPLARPVILCEYSHAMGNSNGSLADYFALFRSKPGLQGGFIWEWLDHGLRQKTADGKEFFAYGGDFGDTPNDANFVCDGLVSPDRIPHPAMWEHKHLAQPVAIEAVNLTQGQIRVRNEQDFTSLGWLRGHWELLLDGVISKSGPLPPMDLAPGEAKELRLSLGRRPLGQEALVNIRFFTAVETLWAKCGHEVAWRQFPLGVSRRTVFVGRKVNPGKFRVSETDGMLIVFSDAIRAAFCLEAGTLVSLIRDGTEFIQRGPLVQLWRGAIDNDGLKLWSGQENKPLGRWRTLGLDHLEHRKTSLKWKSDRRGAVTVSVRHSATGRERWRDCQHTHRYRFLADGVLKVENEIGLGSSDMTDLPRVGVQLVLPQGFEALRYFGRGPRENYCDRKTAEQVGVYESTVSDEYVPYLMPQEHGHHTDVRWLELGNKGGASLRVTGSPTVEFNASHFTAENLYAAKHAHELVPNVTTILYLDAAQRGLGTGSCGPDALPVHRLTARKYRIDFTLTALAGRRPGHGHEEKLPALSAC